MNRHEAETPGALEIPPAYIPNAHVQGYEERDYAMRRPLMSSYEHALTVKRLEAERDAALAEVDRLTARLCSLLLHDGERFGRVAVPNVVRVLLGDRLPWEASCDR